MLLTTSIEIKKLSGAQFAHNDFTKIETDVHLATEALSEIVGQAVIDKAQGIYDLLKADSSDVSVSADDKVFLQHVQLPIAINAAYEYNRSNLVTHGDTGRKALLDKNNESMAWEWMIDRDDYAANIKYQRTIDRLIKYLTNKNIAEWISSDQYQQSLSLFIPTASLFSQYFNIDRSEKFFFLILPLIKEIQLQVIKPAIGLLYEPLITAMQDKSLTPDQEELLSYIRSALPLLTMAKAVKRHSVQVMPEGVVQGYKSFTQGLNANNIATQPAIEWFSQHLERDAQQYFDNIKRYIHRLSPEAVDYRLLPDNDPKKKYART